MAGNHIIIAQFGFIWKNFLNFFVSQIVRNSYIPVARLSPLVQCLDNYSVPQGAIKRAVRNCQRLDSLQEWESGTENTQIILRKCTMPSAIRKKGKISMTSGLSLWKRCS